MLSTQMIRDRCFILNKSECPFFLFWRNNYEYLNMFHFFYFNFFDYGSLNNPSDDGNDEILHQQPDFI